MVLVLRQHLSLRAKRSNPCRRDCFGGLRPPRNDVRRRIWRGSSHGAKRNAGTPAPDYAALHPGYELPLARGSRRDMLRPPLPAAPQGETVHELFDRIQVDPRPGIAAGMADPARPRGLLP